jgi:hypothetical protein
MDLICLVVSMPGSKGCVKIELGRVRLPQLQNQCQYATQLQRTNAARERRRPASMAKWYILGSLGAAWCTTPLPSSVATQAPGKCRASAGQVPGAKVAVAANGVLKPVVSDASTSRMIGRHCLQGG